VFLGRNYHQVMIRGFRIECGEIEARLAEHPAVREAVVLAYGDTDKRLVAYLTGDSVDPADLRSHLASRLPDYMVPSAFVQLDTLPLTPNGKLDRRALPAPDADSLSHAPYEAPLGPVETALAQIWCELLGLERVSRHDSFFALGGHSLLAVRMIERLRRSGLSLAVRDLFQTPVLAELARTLGQHTGIVVPANLIVPDADVITPDMLPLVDLNQQDIERIVDTVPGGVGNIQDIYALSPLQDGMLFHHLLTREGDPYLLVSQMAFASRDTLDLYLSAIAQVVRRHDILRTAFVWEGLSTPAQVVLRNAPLFVTELAFDSKDETVAAQLAARFDPRHYRLDLTQAPLLRFAVAQEHDGRWILQIVWHHLIGDHSTLDILHEEVQAIVDGHADTLHPAVPFRNLIAQARLGTTQEEHENFFTGMLGDISEPTLPFGLAQVQQDGARIDEAHRMLPAALNQRLRAQAQRLN
jgi:aryl carrier-like protein